MTPSKAKEAMERRFWKETRESKPKTTLEYIPLEEREDQSWRDKIEVIPPGQ